VPIFVGRRCWPAIYFAPKLVTSVRLPRIGRPFIAPLNAPDIELAVDLNRINRCPTLEPLAPPSGISGASLLEGGSFLNHGQPGRRQCRSSNNDVSLPLKSYADLPASGRNSGHRWTSQKCLLADISAPRFAERDLI